MVTKGRFAGEVEAKSGAAKQKMSQVWEKAPLASVVGLGMLLIGLCGCKA